jgi:transcription elongation factor GreA-like protein/transcription elongation GreA/GreB family factor
MSYLKEFQKQIELNNYFEFLKLWEEYCYSDQPEGEELIKILNAVKESPLASSFGHHVEKGLSLWENISDKSQKDKILKLIFDLQNTNSDHLAEVALNYLKDKYPNDQYFKEKIRLIGLRSKENFQGAISKYELLNHLKKGNFVYHKAGWGTGEILDLSLIREEMTLEFEYVVGQKQLTFQKALNTLIPLSKDHFLSRRFGTPDLLEEEAKKDPVGIICLLLRDLGEKNALEIKEELCELVIPEQDWSKWWQSARGKIKKSTLIISPENIQEPFKLRKSEISHEEILYAELEKKPSITKTIQLIYSFIRDFPETLRSQEFKSRLHARLTDLISFEELATSQKIQILFLMNDLVENNKYQDQIDEIIKHTTNFSLLLKEIEIISLSKKILMTVKSTKENWQDIFLDELFEIKQNVLRDHLLAELENSTNREPLNQKILKLLNQPTLYPRVFVWYFLKILKNKDAHPLTDQKSINKFHEGFMILLDHLYQDQEHKDLIKKMASELVNDKFIMVRNFMANASIDEVKEFLLLSTKCGVLTDHEIKIIHSLGEVAYPDLKFETKKTDELDQYEVIWTTQEGYNKTQNRLKDISTVETVENAKEIEEARSHGDLRENAEFKAALERRNRLQSEIKLLSDQLKKARILTKNDINPNKPGVGTLVNCERSDGKKITLTILGPWEANPENNILSFQSKLAQSISNLKVGDKFIFQNEEYKILKITSFFG